MLLNKKKLISADIAHGNLACAACRLLNAVRWIFLFLKRNRYSVTREKLIKKACFFIGFFILILTFSPFSNPFFRLGNEKLSLARHHRDRPVRSTPLLYVRRPLEGVFYSPFIFLGLFFSSYYYFSLGLFDTFQRTSFYTTNGHVYCPFIRLFRF